jgi:hypothetical protein
LFDAKAIPLLAQSGHRQPKLGSEDEPADASYGNSSSRTRPLVSMANSAVTTAPTIAELDADGVTKSSRKAAGEAPDARVRRA